MNFDEFCTLNFPAYCVAKFHVSLSSGNFQAKCTGNFLAYSTFYFHWYMDSQIFMLYSKENLHSYWWMNFHANRTANFISSVRISYILYSTANLNANCRITRISCLLSTHNRFSYLLYCTLDLHAHCAMYFQAYCKSVQGGGILFSLSLDYTEYICGKANALK